jgi:hypothetical protein
MAMHRPSVPLALAAKQRIVGAMGTTLVTLVLDGRLVGAAGASGSGGAGLQPVSGAASGLVRDLATTAVSDPSWWAIALSLVATGRIATFAITRRGQ